MDRQANRQWRLIRRPTGLVEQTDFEWKEEPVPHPGPGEALVQNKFLSLDPTNRGWMWERETYLPPQELGAVMRGVCVGTVIRSNDAGLKAGGLVFGMFGWQDYAIAGPTMFLQRSRKILPSRPRCIWASLAILAQRRISA